MRIVSFVLFLMFSLGSMAQGVTIFESEAEESSSDDSGSDLDLDYNNAIKFGMFNLLRGEFVFFYERKLNSMMTAEVGLGATFVNTAAIFGGDILSEIFDFGFSSSGLDNTNFEEFSGIKVSIGPTFQGLYKFFPAKTAMNGFYIGANVRYSRFNSYRNSDEAQEYFDEWGYNTTVTNNSRELEAYRRYFDGLIMAGVEKTNYSGNVYFEWYIGVGFRNISGRDIEKQTTYDSNSAFGTETFVTYSMGSTKSAITPLIAGGLKIGGMW